LRQIREEYLIRVESIQEAAGEKEHISLATKGEFCLKDRSSYITYKETEATGYADCTTTIKADLSGNKVGMLRFGAAQSQLTIEKDIRHICHYDSGAGAFSLGITADEIRCNLTEQGGELVFGYLLDFDEQVVSHNIVQISVRKI